MVRKCQGELCHPLIECAKGQKAGTAGDLATGAIHVDGLLTVEGEGELWYKALYHAINASRGNAGCANPVFINLLEHLCFFD